MQEAPAAVKDGIGVLTAEGSTVMAGGTLSLRRDVLGDASEFQVTWLRAFHAHGGVLFVLSLLYVPFSSGPRCPRE